ncbi:MAG TPA: hypothetical protein VN973_06995, partial [Candidatus Dormibacteraeota bacterium]|nr:hypothetical protein [Candidatus Dormibacteraeota bacterium]
AVDAVAPSGHHTPGLISGLSASGGEIVLGNDLEPASRRLFPALDDAINRLRDAVPGLTMSGTGAALFARFDGRQDAERALEAARGLGYPAWLCRPVPAAA